MAQAFAADGHDVRVYAPGEDPEIPWPELASHYGLRLEFEMRWLHVVPFFRRYDYGIRAVRQARAWGAEIVYTRLPQAAAYASLRGYPVILEVHDIPGGRAGPLLLRAFLRGSGSRRLVVISEALRSELDQRFRLPSGDGFVLVAPDGVDLERYKDLPAPPDARKQLGLPEKFTAGYTGHFYAGRGIDVILPLAAELPDANFLLVGGMPDDIERVGSEILARKLNNVKLVGFVPNEKLPLYQAACDVLLMPYQSRVAASSGGDISRFLSPMKVFEYLACGRVILTSDLPVLQEILSPENSIILPQDDIKAWVQSLKRIQSDPALSMRLAGQAAELAKKYSWHERSQIILENFTENLTPK